MAGESINDKLNKLKQKKQSTVAKNRSQLAKHQDKLRLESIKVQVDDLKEKQERAKKKLTDLDERKKRLKNWDYSIQQDEDWNDRLEKSDLPDDYAQIAERAYTKDLSKTLSPLSQKEYHTQKQEYYRTRSQGIPYVHKPSAEKLESVINHVVAKDERTVRKINKNRIKNSLNGGETNYINDKNKQFNEKLNRHYK
ncbi:BA75_02987T0 [Komagataella pastoris]|uniref:Pre-mRNA-splicing factor SYF2 n=1 Tax=Komagataella pastoris TaxID=4922 RepID=A0A1B2JDQ6_PICPA|nr:BA75_02987T0 [Komagataella pastoris]